MSPALIETMAANFFAAHGGWREPGSDVGALSFDRANEGSTLAGLENRANKCAENGGFGIVNERDPRYVLTRNKYGAMGVKMTRFCAPVAAGDSMCVDELEHLIMRAAHLALDDVLPKKFHNFLTRLIDGLVNEHDLLRWLPKILQMREDGLLS